jgi:DNA-binding MarR family transcriptional regulator
MVSVKTKSEAVGEIGTLLNALTEKFETDGDPERDYLQEHCPVRLHRSIREIPTMGVHLLAAIGEGAVNVVGLAARSGQLKGTVSKHVQRLVEAGLVERSSVPGNRKEIRLSLTGDGQIIDDVHRRMHAEMAAGLDEFLMRYTAAELATVTKVLGDLLHTEKRGVRLVSDQVAAQASGNG